MAAGLTREGLREVVAEALREELRELGPRLQQALRSEIRGSCWQGDQGGSLGVSRLSEEQRGSQFSSRSSAAFLRSAGPGCQAARFRGHLRGYRTQRRAEEFLQDEDIFTGEDEHDRTRPSSAAGRRSKQSKVILPGPVDGGTGGPHTTMSAAAAALSLNETSADEGELGPDAVPGARWATLSTTRPHLRLDGDAPGAAPAVVAPCNPVLQDSDPSAPTSPPRYPGPKTSAWTLVGRSTEPELPPEGGPPILEGTRRQTLLEQCVAVLPRIAQDRPRFVLPRLTQAEEAIGVSCADLPARQQDNAGSEHSFLEVRTFVARVLASWVFEVFSLGMIVSNALLVGVQIDASATGLDGASPTSGLRDADTFFCCFFTVELAAKLYVYRGRFLHMRGWAWNVFDALLVMTQIAEETLIRIADSAGSAKGWLVRGGAVRVARILKSVRAIRVLRVMHSAEDLQLLVSCILHSIRPFLWSALLVMLMVYLVSLWLAEAVADWRSGAAADALSEAVQEQEQDLVRWYGSVPQALLTLFEALTGGVNWDDAIQPLFRAGFQVHGVLVILWIAFSFLAVMNIVTGTFVNTALERAEEVREIRKVIQARRFFKSLDLDMSGTIRFDEVKDRMQTEAVQSYFRSIDVDFTQAEVLFDMLDHDGSGVIELEEFLEACLRLQCPARSADLMLIIRELRSASECIAGIDAKISTLTANSVAVGPGVGVDMAD